MEGSDTDLKSPDTAVTGAKRSFSTPLAILAAGVVIAFAIVYVGKAETPTLKGELPSEELRADVRPVREEDHVFGSRQADVMLIEYSDLECPFCAKIHETLQGIVEASDGKVAWAYRHFPLTSIHANALPGALASECVAELKGNEAFWTFVGNMFRAPELSEQVSIAEAEALGIPLGPFRACLGERRHEARVRTDFDEVIAAGGQGTPYVVVMDRSGRKTAFSGALPRDYIEQIIASVGKR